MGTVAELEKVRKKRGRKLFVRRLIILVSLACFVMAGVYVLRGGALRVAAARAGDTLTAFLTGDKLPVTLSTNRPQYMAASSGRIVLADSSTLEVYSHAGRQIASHPLGYQTPAYRTEGTYTLAYDVGGSRFDLFLWGDRRIAYDGSDPIYCADLSANGNVAIGGGGMGALSGVRVVSDDNLELFRWSSPELMVSAVALESSGNKVAFSGVASEGGEVYSQVSLYRMNSETPLARVALPGEIVVALGYHHSEVVAISDVGVTLIGENGNIKATYAFDETPVRFAISRNRVGIASGEYGDSHSLHITLLDSSLGVQGIWVNEGEIEGMGFDGGDLYIVSNERFIRYHAGREPAESRIPEGILAVVDGGVYYVTPTQLRKMTATEPE